MGEEESEKKAQIVREICNISTLFTSCSHIRSSTRKIGFIDWYLILKVDEDSGSDAIRRRYRQLALQIHPDKNRHPKAEVAFKLVSEVLILSECHSVTAQFDRLRSIRFQDNVNRAKPRRKMHKVSVAKSLEASKPDVADFGEQEPASSSGPVRVQDQLLDDETRALQNEMESA